MIVLIFRKSHVWNTTFFSWTFSYAVIFNYFVSAVENCPNIAMILLFLRTSSGHTFQGIPYFYIGTCAPHDDSQISYIPYALLLFSNIVFFFSSGMARLAPITHKKIHGVFFRTICYFLWCPLVLHPFSEMKGCRVVTFSRHLHYPFLLSWKHSNSKNC